MVAAISSSTVSNWSDALFSKLDTKKQGYVDQSDLASALSTDDPDSTTTSDDAAAMVKAMDSDGDGKVTKSELSSAISKVADELNAQFDSSRVDKSQAGATGVTGVAITDDITATIDDDADADQAVAAAGSGASAGAAKGAAPAAGGASTSSTDTNKYVQAADTDSNGKVSDDEAAAYKKLMAAQAEQPHGAHRGGKPPAASADSADGAASTDSTNGTRSSDQDLARALDMLKQYVNHSGAGTATAASAQTVDTSA